MKLILKPAAAMLVLVTIFSSCQKEDTNSLSEASTVAAQRGYQPLDPGFAENNMVLYWNDKVATVLGAPMIQPARSRYFAIIEIAVYDALNNIKPKYQPYVLNDRQQHANPDAAVASAAYWAIKGLAMQKTFPIDSWYDESLASIPDGDSKELGISLGKKAAEAIIANRSNDGFTQVVQASPFPADGTEPGVYRHTNFLNLRFVPNWGTVVKPYVLKSNYQFRPAGPNALSSTEYAADYNEVKSKGARVGSTRTAAEEMIAKFWAENRPSIIWNNLARAVVANEKMDAWKTARLFALMHTAIGDGLNTGLESAYYFYAWRPDTAIHEGDNDYNSATTADATWIPFVVESPNVNPAGNFVTPPIPEYPASYAMMGSAAAEIIKSVIGKDEINISLNSFSLPGVPLQYTSLEKAALDNAVGKIYAGWHFRKSIVDGDRTGRLIADYIFTHSFQSQD
jgi:hypothetical protein